MGQHGSVVEKSYDLATGSYYGYLIEQAAADSASMLRASWLCDITIPLNSKVRWTEYGTHELKRLVIDILNSRVFVTKWSGASFSEINIYGPTDNDVFDTYQYLRSLWPEIVNDDPNTLPVTFWTLRQSGPSSYSRRIEIPQWSDIAGNYRIPELDNLMSLQAADITNGRIVIWHGQPGTGKTWALRALGGAWRKWCKLHYIIDPERFFGEVPAYLVDVLLDDDDSGQWRLIVVEDAGELLSADAKLRTGQGLSRLLNVTDGLIGQGIKIMFLITTNEESNRLHSAIRRTGRCLSESNFKPLLPDAANAWLQERGWTGAPVVNQYSLADLYGMLNGSFVPEPGRRLGIGF